MPIDIEASKNKTPGTMTKAGRISLFAATILWATIVGGVVYSHVVYFPAYLSKLPVSNSLITGEYGLQDGHFWMVVHPLAILSTILALVLNWKSKARRKLILITASIYALAIVATAIYFVPGLMAFADSGNHPEITPEQWYERGQQWQHLSWIRGAFMCGGFFCLLSAVDRGAGAEDQS